MRHAIGMDPGHREDDVATTAERGIAGTLFVHKAHGLM